MYIMAISQIRGGHQPVAEHLILNAMGIIVRMQFWGHPEGRHMPLGMTPSALEEPLENLSIAHMGQSPPFSGGQE